MDHQRVYRTGNRTYYRNNYVQSPHARPTIEERLHAQGISTSSNSSWTFSNSHSDGPKKKKGRLCGLFLMMAVFVVILAVIAIGGLAFYLGAVRVDNTKQELVFDGSLRVTYGDQYQTVLSNHSSKAFREKAGRYANMLTNVFQRSILAPALEEVRVLRFQNGSLIVKFRMNLDRRKLPNSVTSVEEVLKDILMEEISSVKPIAFRNLQVDHQNLRIIRYLGDFGSTTEETFEARKFEPDNPKTEPTEVKNGVVRKVPPPSESKLHKQQNKTLPIPIIGISEKMQNLSNALKRRQESSSTIATSVFSGDDMKSVEFVKEDGHQIDFGESSNIERVTTSESARLQNVSEIPEVTEGEIPITVEEMTEDQEPKNGHARPPFELTTAEAIYLTPTRTTSNPVFVSPEYDEPWRPIIPSRREPLPVKSTDPDIYDDIVMAPASPEGGGPITFSRESYEENIRVPPGFGGGNKYSHIIEDLAKKYEGLINDRQEPDVDKAIPVDHFPLTMEVKEKPDSEQPLGLDQMMSGMKVVDTRIEKRTGDPSIEEVTTVQNMVEERSEVIDEDRESAKRKSEQTELINEETATVKNPFQDSEDSRSASAFSFDLPELPILKQFHHLDSLLKSFADDASTEDSMTHSSPAPETITRFPVRTKPTTKHEDKIFVEVSTIVPDNATRKRSEDSETPVVIKGEVQVLDGTSTITTEPQTLVTLLPVRSNLRGPLRPRPKAAFSLETSHRRSPKKASDFWSSSRVLYSVPQKHHIVDDKDGKRWVYYSSSKLHTTTTAPGKTEKLFIVTPESGKKSTMNTTTAITTVKATAESSSIENISEKSGSNELEGREQIYDTDSSTSDLINRIVNIMENVVISTGNATKVILKVNQTIINGTGINGFGKLNESASNDPKFIISNKAVSSHYKLNQAGVPILTKILNKAPNHDEKAGNKKPEMEARTEENMEEAPQTTVPGADCNLGAVSCGNGTCLPPSSRCNQQVECPDAVDEKNCTCAEYLKTQHLNRKLCDGVVDCWDFSDEFDCDWCKGKDYLCSNSKICIKKSQICDGANNCPMGDDERYCVTVSPNEKEANSFNYHPNGYLMVRKHGEWGKLCIDNFDSVTARSKTGWKISDLGRSVCKALTFRDFDKVERMISVPNQGRSVEPSEPGRYYELSYNDVGGLESSTRDSTLSFHETQCSRKEVVRVTCTELECGLRPQAMNQWSRIVGGGNANPGSWPWQAALYKEGEFQCGATLISGQWLVSAGHCFYHNQDDYWVARLGTLRTTSSLPSPYEQLRQISRIILHPHYVDTGFINDISLLKMADPVTFTDYVRPICLPKPNARIIDGMMCTVVGWGQLFELGRIFPDTLQEVQLPIISSTECRKRTVFLPLYKITDDMFCAGYDRGGRDACLGDSGGPLMCQESDGKWSLYGVTSNGYGCARSNRPGVYTKVSKYLHWLQAQMNLHSEDEILSQSSLKQLSLSSWNDSTIAASSNPRDRLNNHKGTEALIKLISERVSNVKFNTGASKKSDKCKGHRCPLGECLPKSRMCNGVIECSDGSDEKDCW